MRIAFALTLFFLSGCSPFYVARAAIEQVSILSSRQPIDEIINNPLTDPETKEKLQLIKQAKAFSNTLGLKDNNSFSTYVSLDRPELSWVVMGSQKTSFEVKNWWFPFVGWVPYKGFFDQSTALDFAKDLEDFEQLETWVRPTDAYSTLGWFDDPVISTFLRRPHVSIVETVIHEQLHATHWFKNNAEFNETAANIAGLIGAINYFEQADPITKEKYLETAKQNLERAKKIDVFINNLYLELSKIYDNKLLSSDEKLILRNQKFDELISPIRQKNPAMTSFQKVNNAEIMQVKTYYSDFAWIYQQYEACGSLKEFIEKLPLIFENYTNSK